MQIIVTGCSRSGTSLTTRIIQACGGHLGHVNVLAENTDIREPVLKPLIRQAGGDERGQVNLPPRDCEPDHEMLQHKMTQRLGESWCYKDPKILLVWRAFRNAFPDAKWVICRRDIDQIAQSCMTTGFMNAYSTLDGWKGWAQQYLDRIEDLKRDVEYREVWPMEAVDGDLSQYRALIAWLGLKWNPEAERVVDPRQWHYR